MRVVVVVGGYPTAEEPQHGIFTQRAVSALRESADVAVVQLRTWRPGRPARERAMVSGIPVLRIAVPQVPLGAPMAISFNVMAFQFSLTYRWVAEELERA